MLVVYYAALLSVLVCSMDALTFVRVLSVAFRPFGAHVLAVSTKCARVHLEEAVNRRRRRGASCLLYTKLTVWNRVLFNAWPCGRTQRAALTSVCVRWPTLTHACPIHLFALAVAHFFRIRRIGCAYFFATWPRSSVCRTHVCSTRSFVHSIQLCRFPVS